MRACGSCTKLLVTGSTPCIPATKTKSPALTPKLQVPSALMAPGGLRVLTPLGDVDWAKPSPGVIASVARHRRARRVSIFVILSRPGVGAGVGLQQELAVDLGIALRGREARVSQQLLDRA